MMIMMMMVMMMVNVLALSLKMRLNKSYENAKYIYQTIKHTFIKQTHYHYYEIYWYVLISDNISR